MCAALQRCRLAAATSRDGRWAHTRVRRPGPSHSHTPRAHLVEEQVPEQLQQVPAWEESSSVSGQARAVNGQAGAAGGLAAAAGGLPHPQTQPQQGRAHTATPPRLAPPAPRRPAAAPVAGLRPLRVSVELGSVAAVGELGEQAQHAAVVQLPPHLADQRVTARAGAGRGCWEAGGPRQQVRRQQAAQRHELRAAWRTQASPATHHKHPAPQDWFNLGNTHLYVLAASSSSTTRSPSALSSARQLPNPLPAAAEQGDGAGARGWGRSAARVALRSRPLDPAPHASRPGVLPRPAPSTRRDCGAPSAAASRPATT